MDVGTGEVNTAVFQYIVIYGNMLQSICCMDSRAVDEQSDCNITNKETRKKSHKKENLALLLSLNDQTCRNPQSAVDDGKCSPHFPSLCFSAANCLFDVTILWTTVL